MRFYVWYLLMLARLANWRARRASESALVTFEKLSAADPNNEKLKEQLHMLRRMIINNKVQKNAIDDDLKGL